MVSWPGPLRWQCAANCRFAVMITAHPVTTMGIPTTHRAKVDSPMLLGTMYSLMIPSDMHMYSMASEVMNLLLCAGMFVVG